MRLFNFFWIVFCAAIIEMTLNENHMLDVLSQNIDGLRSPAQLVPLCIGAASFLRTCYLIIHEHGKNVVEILHEEAIGSPTSTIYKIRRAVELTIHRFVFPAAMHGQNPDDHSEEALGHTGVAPENRQGHYSAHGNYPAWVRYAVAYLPWLASFGTLFSKPFHHSQGLPTTMSGDYSQIEKEEAMKPSPEIESTNLNSPVPT
jgi:hypothetical protein